MSRDAVIRDGSKLVFENDWSAWLPTDPAETIDSRLWTISPAGPTLTNETTDKVAVEGVTFGTIYRLTEHVILTDGQEEDRTIILTPVR